MNTRPKLKTRAHLVRSCGVFSFLFIVALTNLGMGAGWASLLVGVVVGIVGLVLLQNGRSLLKEGIVPKRTQAQVQRDAEMLKEQVK